METTLVSPSLKNVAQKVNEWGNAYSGLIGAVGLLATVLILVRQVRK